MPWFSALFVIASLSSIGLPFLNGFVGEFLIMLGAWTTSAVQHAWIVTGARFGWSRGAEALRLLIVADQKAMRLWGLGHKSELAARHALAEVEARSR